LLIIFISKKGCETKGGDGQKKGWAYYLSYYIILVCSDLQK